MKGDKVRVLLDGVDEPQTYTADKAGRTIDYELDRKTGYYVIEVKGRAGTAVRTINLRADRVILIEEVPA